MFTSPTLRRIRLISFLTIALGLIALRPTTASARPTGCVTIKWETAEEHLCCSSRTCCYTNWDAADRMTGHGCWSQ
jgi:hypothetical protein